MSSTLGAPRIKIPFGWETVKSTNPMHRLRKDIDLIRDPHPTPKPNARGMMPPKGYHWVGDGLNHSLCYCGSRDALWIGYEEARRRMEFHQAHAKRDALGSDMSRIYLKGHETENERKYPLTFNQIMI